MSNLLVKITKGPDGNKVMELGINIQMTGVMRAGIVEQLGFRKASKKFIDGVCKAMIKQIQPQLLEAIKKENHFHEHPEDIPAPPEGVKPPPLNHALLAEVEESVEEVGNPKAICKPDIEAHVPCPTPDGYRAEDQNAGEGSEGNPGVQEPDQEPHIGH